MASRILISSYRGGAVERVVLFAAGGQAGREGGAAVAPAGVRNRQPNRGGRRQRHLAPLESDLP